MGGFSTISGGGVTKHTDLLNKEVNGVIDHADRSITRTKLEYPTVDVPLLYLFGIGKASVIKRTAPNEYAICLFTIDSFADKAVEVAIWDKNGMCMARWIDTNNFYICNLDSSFTTQDFILAKRVAGTDTRIGYEAVDITASIGCVAKLSTLGSTIKAYRDNMTTPKISVTDTSLSSGLFGEGCHMYGGGLTRWSVLRAPSSPSPLSTAYFEVPVVGSGTQDDPFRAQMPELIDWEWSLNPLAKKKYDVLKAKGFTDDEIQLIAPEVLSCKVNRLALTQSSLIKTDRATGKPVEYVTIVRVFDQPNRQAHLHPIPKALDALRAMPGVKELTRDEAIRRAKQIDYDLTDVDLISIKATDLNFRTMLKDYIAHRVSLGVKRELIDDKLMEQYLIEDKGW